LPPSFASSGAAGAGVSFAAAGASAGGTGDGVGSTVGVTAGAGVAGGVGDAPPPCASAAARVATNKASEDTDASALRHMREDEGLMGDLPEFLLD
jgi:hypothetical protein